MACRTGRRYCRRSPWGDCEEREASIASLSSNVGWSSVKWRSILSGYRLGRLRHHGGASHRLDPDRGGLELRRAGLRILGVDGQLVGGHLIGEVEGHECEAGPQALVEADRREH